MWLQCSLGRRGKTCLRWPKSYPKERKVKGEGGEHKSSRCGYGGGKLLKWGKEGAEVKGAEYYSIGWFKVSK